jgi:hypothetical protein
MSSQLVRILKRNKYESSVGVLVGSYIREKSPTLKDVLCFFSHDPKTAVRGAMVVVADMCGEEDSKKEALEFLEELLKSTYKEQVIGWVAFFFSFYIVGISGLEIAVEKLKNVTETLRVIKPPSGSLCNDVFVELAGFAKERGYPTGLLRRAADVVAACIRVCPYMIDDGICLSLTQLFQESGSKKNRILPFSADIVAAAPSDIPTICKVAEQLGLCGCVPRDVEQVVERHLASILGGVAVSLISLADADDDKGVVVPPHESLVCGVISVLADECHVRSLRI